MDVEKKSRFEFDLKIQILRKSFSIKNSIFAFKIKILFFYTRYWKKLI